MAGNERNYEENKNGGVMTGDEAARLLGRVGDREFWTETVRQAPMYERFRRGCLDEYEKHGLDSFDFSALKYSDYKLYWQTGDRGIYENAYFARRTALDLTVPLALMYPEERKYIDKIMDWVFAICDEYSWCLPAHQGKLEAVNSTVIDLFSSESGFWLALIYHLLGDRMDTLVRDRIEVEIERRIIKPFLAVDNYGWWETGKNNWTAVCICNVAACVMLMRPALVTDELIERFNTAIGRYIDGFGDDGICLEGCGYWAYGVGFFTMYADMMRRFTDGRIDWFAHPRVKAIATFPQRMFLSGRAAVSFADSGRVLSYAIGVLHRLKDEFPDDVLIYSPDYASYDLGCGRLGYRLFTAAWMREEYYYSPADDTVCFENYAENARWLVKRTASYGFAAKAGNNDEMHNHNDVGSFIFTKNGRQWLVDIGSGKYTRQYFSSERYSILETSGIGHSLPLFDGETQRAGAEYAASDVYRERGVFSMDIAGAYGLDGVRSARRRFDMAEDAVVMTDSFDTDRAVTERLVAMTEPQQNDNGVIIVGDAKVEFDPERATVSFGTAQSTANGTVYFIDLELRPNVKEISLRIS